MNLEDLDFLYLMVVRYESSEDASKDISQGYRRRTALDAETVAISNKSMKTMEDP